MQAKYENEILEIKSTLAEETEIEFYGKRNCVNQFRIRSVSGELLSEDHVLLISLDKTKPEANVNYYGEIEIFYCTKDHLKVEKYYQKIFDQKQWNDGFGKICLQDILAGS